MASLSPLYPKNFLMKVVTPVFQEFCGKTGLCHDFNF